MYKLYVDSTQIRQKIIKFMKIICVCVILNLSMSFISKIELTANTEKLQTHISTKEKQNNKNLKIQEEIIITENKSTKISFDKEIDDYYKIRSTVYKEVINKKIISLKDIPFNDDLEKVIQIYTIRDYNLSEDEFVNYYKDYIISRYKELYSTKYKKLSVFKGSFTDCYYIVFKYKE